MIDGSFHNNGVECSVNSYIDKDNGPNKYYI